MKIKKKWLVVIVLFITALIYTLAVKFIDVKPIGPNSSKVGFALINNFFKETFSFNEAFYKITKYLGIIPFLLIAFYAFIGISQLIKRKSILKVDKKILFLGLFYILVGITYLFFEKVIINYRPILLENILEASYPSSHTMLALTICLSSLLIEDKYIKNENLSKIIKILTIALLILLVVGRIISGVHWISDIIGGIIISLFLVSIYYALIKEEKEL